MCEDHVVDKPLWADNDTQEMKQCVYCRLWVNIKSQCNLFSRIIYMSYNLSIMTIILKVLLHIKGFDIDAINMLLFYLPFKWIELPQPTSFINGFKIQERSIQNNHIFRYVYIYCASIILALGVIRGFLR